MPQRKRYVQVGTGGRHILFRDALVKEFSDRCELVALCDKNEGRLRLSQRQIQEMGGPEIPLYLDTEFDKMLDEQKPDCVIVTTMDCTHDDYICRAMEAGCDVVTEKPMTTDDAKCRRIIETQKRTGRRCRVTFNYRYSPPRTQIKDLLMSGAIGEPLSVDFHWMLDTSHGADYYRRWHGNKANSGGLMVHKATHHFDMVNWWIGSVAERVFASGHRRFYTPKTADRYGLTNRAERCHVCPEGSKCPFHLSMKDNAGLTELYLDCEKYDGYYRDQCVFGERLDIEDSMHLTVDYRNGVKMSYSLNSSSPWEGYHIVINGSRGRLEHKCEETVYINADGSVPGALKREGTWTRIFPHFRPAYEEEIWEAKGGHGGGDWPLVEDVLSENPPADKYLRAADQRAGAWSILVGIAANHSMAQGKPILLDDLVPGLEEPDYPPMPTGDEPLEGRP